MPGRIVVGLAVTAVCLLVSAVFAGGQSSPPDPFVNVGFLIGRWEGTSEGQPGKGTVRREYARVLNSRFIRVHNHSEYPAQDKNPKSEIHEDEGWFSFDRARKRLVLRQFHVEGFVNQYVENADSSLTKVVFTTESIENIPAGGRRVKPISFMAQTSSKSFELAEGGKPSRCIRAHGWGA